MKFQTKQITFLVLAALSANVMADSKGPVETRDTFEGHAPAQLEDVVVTATHANGTVSTYFDPKNPVQPIPAADGAGLLKTIPNMSLVRKGGMSSDPQFRGLGGTRLNVQVGGTTFHGGCGGRMDPPTSYVFPNAYDSVVVTKGPQSVVQGPNVITGSVLFNRNFLYFPEKGFRGDVSVTGGNFGRFDADLLLEGGFNLGYARIDAHFNRQGNYKDGDEHEYHTKYQRHNENITIGLTPNQNMALELNYSIGRGWAYYADRMMDGKAFDRDMFSARGFWKDINPTIRKIGFDFGFNKINHVMDNYSYRKMQMKGKDGMPMFVTSNPSRKVYSGKVFGDLAFGPVTARVGVDFLNDEHSSKPKASAPTKEASLKMSQDAKVSMNQKFVNTGIFAQANWEIAQGHKLVAGYRFDIHNSKANEKKNPKLTKEQLDQTDYFHSGFGRYEFNKGPVTLYGGVGVAHRAPDFWDRMKQGGYNLKPEMNVEFDGGVLYSGQKLSGSFNVFASRITDFMLVAPENKIMNVDANRFGFEGDIEWRFYPNWSVGTAVSYTYAQDVTNDAPLPRTNPMEFNSHIGYDNGKWSAQLVMRNVLKQDRIHKGYGTILGTDTAPSKAFTVLSVNGGWNITKNTILTAGIDNILNETYAEFTSKNGATIDGYNPTNGLTLNEPGRTFWLRLRQKF